MSSFVIASLLLLFQVAFAVNEGEVCQAYGKSCICREAADCQTSPQTAISCCDPGLVCCPNTGISQRKCEEYARLVYTYPKSRWSIGKRASGCATISVPLIVGGNLAGPAEIPHMALLGYGPMDTNYWLCGGSLISERYVVTAAHCLHSNWGPVTWVRLGSWTDGKPGPGAQQLAVSARIKHPRYFPPATYNDIALLRLATLPALGAVVRPACLFNDFTIPSKSALAAGYGQTDFASDDFGAALRKVWLSLVPLAECSHYFRAELGTGYLPKGLLRSMLCAGDLDGGRDTCKGDSGGPLQIPNKHPFCSYCLVGVTSFGKLCGFPNSPAVYTRISHYVPWLESIVWPKEVHEFQQGRDDDDRPVWNSLTNSVEGSEDAVWFPDKLGSGWGSLWKSYRAKPQISSTATVIPEETTAGNKSSTTPKTNAGDTSRGLINGLYDKMSPPGSSDDPTTAECDDVTCDKGFTPGASLTVEQ